MEYRDFLMDQIQQMGKVLAKIFSSFFGLKSEGKVAKGIEVSNQQLKTELDIDVENLINLSVDDLKKKINELKLTPSHIESLTKYISEIGIYHKNSDQNKSKKYFETAISLLDIADEISNTVSLRRMEMKDEIVKSMKSLN
jgi:hypothetical protein